MAEHLTSPGGEMDGMEVRLHVSFPAEIDAVAPLVERVLQIAREQKFPEDKEGEIGLAVQEALVNAVKHGCKSDASKTVHCWVASGSGGGILIVIRDPGPGFDPAALPNPHEGEHIFRDHGRGIFLINQLMDDVRFERGGTELRMRKDNKS
jgi:serine/threonine-protein kinase RsbW